MGKTIIVSNRLPLSAARKNGMLEFKLSSGGLATGLGCVFSKNDTLWIGWPGAEIKETEEQAVVSARLRGEKMFPVYLDSQEIERFYEGFSNSVLWPAFHYFPQHVTNDRGFWDSYVKVNEKFCAVIVEKAKSEDTIWIHDYHLLLLPQMVREKLPEATIAFFQHIPFPSYEIFRMLSCREELLAGICGADLVGFHTYDDTQHFMSAVSRVLGYSNEKGYIRAEGHLVNVDAFPLGIDYQKYRDSAAHTDTLEVAESYRATLGKQKLLLSIDRLDYSKGIPQRLMAFDLFLEENVDQRGKISLMMIVVPSRENVKEYAASKKEIDTLVGRINSRYSQFGWVPIHCFYRSFSLTELSAFYHIADVGLVTPLRDGMNLVCKEYVASKTDKKGVLVLSEMAGASKELQEAVLVNPNDIQEVARAIQIALTMDEEEQMRRISCMQESLRKHDAFQWVNVFMSRLTHVKQKQVELKSRKLHPLEFQRLKVQFGTAKKPIILLDYDGVLEDYGKQSEVAFPGRELKSLIHNLANKALVVIISGRDRGILEKLFEHDPVNLVAEHGLWIKRKDRGKGWKALSPINNGWKSNFLEAMDYYVLRTPDVFVEEKNNSLVWHYRSSENGFGDLRRREVFSHLKYLAQGYHLQVLEGDMTLEIKRPGINKSKAATSFLTKEEFDFILVVGDHWSAEETFSALPSWAISICVGCNYTTAKYNVPSHKEAEELLQRLTVGEMLKLVMM